MARSHKRIQQQTGVTGFIVCLIAMALNIIIPQSEKQWLFNTITVGGIGGLTILTIFFPSQKMRYFQVILFALTGVAACLLDRTLYISGDLLITSAFLLGCVYGISKNCRRDGIFCLIVFGFYRALTLFMIDPPLPSMSLMALPGMGFFIYFVNSLTEKHR